MKLVKQKKELRRKHFKPERSTILLKVQLIMIIMASTIEAILEKTMLKLLISIDIRNVSNVMTSDNRNVKYCSLQTVTIAGY